MAGVGGQARWTQAELREAPSQVLDAARWALYAERLWPGADLEAQLAAPEKPTEHWQRQQRVKARSRLFELRQLLLPPDEEESDDAG